MYDITQKENANVLAEFVQELKSECIQGGLTDTDIIEMEGTIEVLAESMVKNLRKVQKNG
jgi:hypothetical protein